MGSVGVCDVMCLMRKMLCVASLAARAAVWVRQMTGPCEAEESGSGMWTSDATRTMLQHACQRLTCACSNSSSLLLLFCCGAKRPRRCSLLHSARTLVSAVSASGLVSTVLCGAAGTVSITPACTCTGGNDASRLIWHSGAGLPSCTVQAGAASCKQHLSCTSGCLAQCTWASLHPPEGELLALLLEAVLRHLHSAHNRHQPRRLGGQLRQLHQLRHCMLPALLPLDGLIQQHLRGARGCHVMRCTDMLHTAAGCPCMASPDTLSFYHRQVTPACSTITADVLQLTLFMARAKSVLTSAMS